MNAMRWSVTTAVLIILLACGGDDSGGGAGAASIAPPGASCTERYAPTQICGEDGSSCTFFMQLGGQSCSDYCNARGGSCFSADLNDGTSPCTAMGPAACTTPSEHQICSCNL